MFQDCTQKYAVGCLVAENEEKQGTALVKSKTRDLVELLLKVTRV